MITLYDFNMMDNLAQADAIFSQGIFIDDRIENGLNVQLYRLDNFYVEIFYDTKLNGIISYRSFKSPGQLAPYVKLI
jgi:hypothetical protein